MNRRLEHLKDLCSYPGKRGCVIVGEALSNGKIWKRRKHRGIKDHFLGHLPRLWLSGGGETIFPFYQ
jgi:hypothetical protein